MKLNETICTTEKEIHIKNLKVLCVQQQKSFRVAFVKFPNENYYSVTFPYRLSINFTQGTMYVVLYC